MSEYTTTELPLPNLIQLETRAALKKTAEAHRYLAEPMKYLTLLITLVFAATSYASPAGNPTRYEPEQLSGISLSVTNRGYLLTYRTPLESLHFSPGIKLIEKEGSTYIEVIRCKIDHECAVDFKSVYGDSGISEVVIDSDGSKDSIFLMGSETSLSL